jgi:hypothetical protein
MLWRWFGIGAAWQVVSLSEHVVPAIDESTKAKSTYSFSRRSMTIEWEYLVGLGVVIKRCKA